MAALISTAPFLKKSRSLHDKPGRFANEAPGFVVSRTPSDLAPVSAYSSACVGQAGAGSYTVVISTSTVESGVRLCLGASMKKK